MSDLSRLAGETGTIPLPNVESSTPGQFAARWNLHTEQQRQEWLDGMHEAVRRGQDCFMQDHLRHLAALEAQVWSETTLGGRRLTWRALAEHLQRQIALSARQGTPEQENDR